MGCLNIYYHNRRGYPYMVDLCRNRVGNYVKNVVSKPKPRKPVVCMIYHLDEACTGSWADPALCCLGCCITSHTVS